MTARNLRPSYSEHFHDEHGWLECDAPFPYTGEQAARWHLRWYWGPEAGVYGVEAVGHEEHPVYGHPVVTMYMDPAVADGSRVEACADLDQQLLKASFWLRTARARPTQPPDEHNTRVIL